MSFVSLHFVTFQQEKDTRELLTCARTGAFNQPVPNTLQIDFLESGAPTVFLAAWVSAGQRSLSASSQSNQTRCHTLICANKPALPGAHLSAAPSGRLVYNRVKQTPRLK